MEKTPASTFGTWLKSKRAEKGLTLRAFAEKSGIDPGNLSRYERGIISPPQDEALTRIGRALGLREGSEDWRTLHDLAAICAGRIPRDLAEDPELVGRLPVLFRAARGKRLGRDELIRLAERIRRG
jgi:transcriptional regulator with XRE-family HTH domain